MRKRSDFIVPSIVEGLIQPVQIDVGCFPSELAKRPADTGGKPPRQHER
jgi:hypothetical protein